MQRLLFTIRNIGKQTAYRKLALESPTIELSIKTPVEPEKLKKYVLIEDLSIPGYANTKTATEEFRTELLTILSGESQRWKLWEVLVYEEYISLHYADAETPSRYVTALSLHLSWAPITELSFNVPVVRIPLNNFRISCAQADDQHRVLEIKYSDIEHGLEHQETYVCTPLIRG